MTPVIEKGGLKILSIKILSIKNPNHPITLGDDDLARKIMKRFVVSTSLMRVPLRSKAATSPGVNKIFRGHSIEIQTMRFRGREE